LEQTLHYEICHGGAVFFAAKAGLLARVPSPAELALPQGSPKVTGAARSSAGGGKNKSAAGLFLISIE
jgi:hypothetical protein